MFRSLLARILVLLVALLTGLVVLGCSGDEDLSQTSGASASSEPTVTSLPAAEPGPSDQPTTLPTSGPSGTTLVAGDAQFTRENWGLLASNPGAYKGAVVAIVGRLLQEPVRRDDGAYWQMYADPKNYEWNTSVHYSDPSFPATIDDFVRVTGTVNGGLEGQNAYGETVMLVDISADTAEMVDAVAAASPAERTALLETNIDQHGLVITVQKVEFAADETRVFVDVFNGSAGTASLYDLQLATATQEETVYQAETLWDYYPTVDWELPPGADSSGIIVFPPLEASQPLEIDLEAGSDDYTLSFAPYVFAVPSPE